MKILDVDRIYADNNASTPVDPKVKEAIIPYLDEEFGNPNSLHKRGREAREAVEEARGKVASMLNCSSKEIIFTGSATESNNHVIKGTAFARKDEGKHIITNKIEHKCVLEACRWLEEHGFEVTYLDVDEEGYVDPEELRKELRDDTILVSVMMANNEIGTIQPIEELVEVTKDNSDAYFHTDMAQCPGKMKVDVEEPGVDLATINAHKMYGPKGVGALYRKKGVDIDPLLHGGGQEDGERSSTENVPYIVGFGKACEIAEESWTEDKKRLTKMQERLIEEVRQRIDDVKLNGPEKPRLPGNANLSFIGVEGEALVLRLDERGIGVATGSACSSEELKASHVLKAIGRGPEIAHSSLRISYGRFNTMEDVNKTVEVLEKEVEDLRSITAVDSKGKIGD
ncbi:MAG: cysteine desulfurase family protein [Candidatus Aenigmatarchaeota archaeon]